MTKSSKGRVKKKTNRPFWIFQSILLLFILTALILLANGDQLPWKRARRIADLENRVQELQELVTVNQIFRDVIYSQEKKFFSDKRILFSINFEIKAGIPMERARVSMNLQGIPEVTLPRAEIFSVDADETSIEEIFIREQFALIHQSDYMEVLIQEKERLTQEAMERGILSESEIQARQMISRLFSLAGFEEVIFTFQEESL